MEGHHSLTWCVLLLTFVRVVQLQAPVSRSTFGNCSALTEADLGSATELTTQGIVASTFPVAAAGAGEVANRVRILNHLVVCEASAATRDTLSSVSLIVEYEWCSVSGTCNPATATSQFQFDCLGGENSFLAEAAKNGGDPTRTDNPTGNFQTTPTDQCSECSQPSGFIASDPDTHCLGCNAACVGLGKCLGEAADQCCNYYFNDECVISCPVNLVANEVSGFNCGCVPQDVGVGVLTTSSITNSFSSVDTVVTQRCDSDNGYFPVPAEPDSVTTTCTLDGWDVENIVCEFRCDATDLVTSSFGQVEVTGVPGATYPVGAVATFSCSSGDLSGGAVRTCLVGGWNGENPVCVVDLTILTIIPSKPLSVLLGDYISLNCSSTPPADMDISYTWTHLNTSTLLEETSNILTFPRISVEELGTYRCSAASAAESEVTITSARPLIQTGSYPARIISGSCPSPQLRDDILVDVLQLLSAQFGVYPLGLTMLYSAESCDQVAEANPGSPSGMYWIYSDGNPVQVFCQF